MQHLLCVVLSITLLTIFEPFAKSNEISDAMLMDVFVSHNSLRPKDFMLSGGISTAATDLFLFPLDTIKVKQQSSRLKISGIQAAKDILRDDGVGAFFRGALSYAFIDGCAAAIFFSTYEQTKGLFARKFTGSLLGLSMYASASAAFAFSSVILVPGELIKLRMQTGAYANSLECVADAISEKRGGFRGLYSGYLGTVARDLPYFAVQLGCFENIRNLLLKMATMHYPGRTSEHMLDILSGIGAGIITGLVTNPMDVVTTRLMTQKDEAPGFMECVNRMRKEEGLRSFFIGSLSRVIWIAPYTAISLGLNERIKRELIAIKSMKRTTVNSMIPSLGLGATFFSRFRANKAR